MNLREISLAPFTYQGQTMHHGTSVGLLPIQLEYHVADPNTVGMALWTGSNEISDLKVNGKFFCKLYELVDGLPRSATQTPRYFGVGFRFGITDIGCVNLFCHPEPTVKAGYKDSEYIGLTGHWSDLYRFVEELSRQMVPGGTNMVLVMPMFSHTAWLSESGTILSAHWRELLNSILVEVQKIAWPDPPGGPIVRNQDALRDIILSDFSAGRALMERIRTAPDLASSLREIWDFDGYGTAPPNPPKGGQVLRYNQEFHGYYGYAHNVFHVPFPVWKRFSVYPMLKAASVKKRHDLIHAMIPATLFYHAATKSAFGH